MTKAEREELAKILKGRRQVAKIAVNGGQPSCGCPVSNEPDGSVICWCGWSQQRSRGRYPREALLAARALAAEGRWRCPSCWGSCEATLAELVLMGGPNVWVPPGEYEDCLDDQMLISVRCGVVCGWRTTLCWVLEQPFVAERSGWAGLWDLESLELLHPLSPDQRSAWLRYLGVPEDDEP